jgi:hypothetical protein
MGKASRQRRQTRPGGPTRSGEAEAAGERSAGALRRALIDDGAIWITLGLIALTVVIYAPAAGFAFVNSDDPTYVTQNPYVLTGLTWENVVWAFTEGREPYWHPITWLSHMLDVQLFGTSAGGPHVVNFLLHAANAVLVFAVFRRMTGSRWRSAFLAGLFAVHPLRVESVAWVAERKDVLSSTFWLLTMWAYVAARRPRSSRRARSSTG